LDTPHGAKTQDNLPTVSVLTAVYNAEAYIAATIESVLNQSFTDFEYILINDCATDNTPNIVMRYARQDVRIVLLHNARSLGPSGALNRGLEVARGEYIAILDHDDLVVPQRLMHQVRFLEENPTIAAVGGYINKINAEGKVTTTADLAAYARFYPTTPAGVRWMLHFHPPLPHCTLTVRRAALTHIGGYSVRHQFICDYDVQVRLAEHFDLANVAEILGSRRMYKGQTSDVQRSPQNGMYFLRMAAVMRQRLRAPVTLKDVETLYYAIGDMGIDDRSRLAPAAALLEQLYCRFIADERLTRDEAAWVATSYALLLRKLARTNRHHGEAWIAPLLMRCEELEKIRL
jgi:glycosyltransferase involved in cell wall biosynthesis